MRLVGDTHGMFRAYDRIIQGVDYSLQLGDFGFHDAYEHLLKKVDASRHKFIGGNHENYDYLGANEVPHYLGDYGVITHGGITFFQVRGAFSIDKEPRLTHQFRTGIKSWFEQEEMSYTQLNAVLKLYKELKPDLVLTHDAPQEISEIVGKPAVLRQFGFEPPLRTRTQLALQAMFEVHQPSRWFFGHYHRSWNSTINGTKFQCLDELEWLDI